MFFISIKDLNVILNDQNGLLEKAGFSLSKTVLSQHPKAAEILYDVKNKDSSFSFTYIQKYEEKDELKKIDNILERTKKNFAYSEEYKDIIYMIPDEDLTPEMLTSRKYSEMLDSEDYDPTQNSLFYNVISAEDFLSAYKKHKEVRIKSRVKMEVIREYHDLLRKIGIKYKFNTEYLRNHFSEDCKGLKATLGNVELHLDKLRKQFDVFKKFDYEGHEISILNNDQILWKNEIYKNLDIVIEKIELEKV